MRAQFNKTGTSSYHVYPAPERAAGRHDRRARESGHAAPVRAAESFFADLNISWWSSQIQNLITQGRPDAPRDLSDRRRAAVHRQDVLNCCVIGYHGTRASGAGNGSSNCNGNAKVKTFAWASYISPGIYARPNGGTAWALQDIHASATKSPNGATTPS